MNTITHWINNKAYPGTGGSTSPVTNPATGEVTGQLALASVEDARAVIDAAAAAFPAWRDTSLTKRTSILFNFRELLNERKRELAEIITSEHGKVVSDALGEVSRGQEVVEFASGHVDVELFVTTGVAYEVRTEVVAEKGSAMIGLDVGLVRKVAPGTWGGRITPGFRERFGQAYDTEFQRWVDAVHAGMNVDGPDAWDGYAAAAVCEAGVESLNSGLPVEVKMVDRTSIKGASA